MVWYISRVTMGSSPATGSSSSSMVRVAHKARASSARCCCPPDSSAKLLFLRSSMPISARFRSISSR